MHGRPLAGIVTATTSKRHGPLQWPPAGHVVVSHLDDDATFRPSDGLERGTVRLARARLDLDEDQGIAVPSDDVQFSKAGAVPAIENFVPAAPELPAVFFCPP